MIPMPIFLPVDSSSGTEIVCPHWVNVIAYVGGVTTMLGILWMVTAVILTVGLLIIVLSTVTTTFLDAFSAGISSETIWSGFKGKYVAIFAAILGTAGAILFPMDDITDFLYLIGSVFAPMIAIQIADYFVLKKKPFKNAVNVQNLVIWAIGFAAYRILMRVDTPVGNTLPDMVLTVLLCLVVSAVRGNKDL